MKFKKKKGFSILYINLWGYEACNWY